MTLRVLVVTTVHVPRDARIDHRQVGALLRAGAEVTHVAPWTAQEADQADPRGPVRRVPVPRSVGRRRLGPLLAAARVTRRLVDQHDIVLLHDPELLLLAPLLVRRRPVVWDVHEDTAASLTDRSWVPTPVVRLVRHAVHAAERWADRRLHLLLAEHSYADLFRGDHPVVPNVPFLLEAPPGPAGERVVYVGRVSRSRGAEALLRLPDHLPPGLRLEIVGPPDADVARPLAAAAAAGRLTAHGFVPNAQALELVDGAFAGLSLLQDHPNHRDCLQSKVLEYLERGVPVVATDLRVAGAFVRDRGVGAVVPTGSPDEVAAAVGRALAAWVEDPGRREEAARRGRALVVEGMNWDVEGARFVAHLRRWAAEGRP
ncbi:MAG: glycosyltransferase [Actinomycetes bacterium]